MKKRMSTKDLVLCALLAATVVILQCLGSFIKFGPFSVSLVLVPIVIGAALCGKTAGAILGGVFGLTVLFTDSAAFVAINAPATFLTVMLKGILSGLCAGLLYGLFEKRNKRFAIISAAIICPVVNTGVFLICCKLFFMTLINQWSAALGFASAGKYMIFGLTGGNFIFETLVNIVLIPVILKLINFKSK